jgi:NADP-dependent alcohol dehydrogenase
MVAHELTAFYGIDHARTLAIILPRLYRNQFENKLEKLAQYGERVWGLTGKKEEIAMSAIDRTEQFFNELGIATRVSAYTSNYLTLAQDVQKRFEERGWTAMGERQAITPGDVHDIVQQSI